MDHASVLPRHMSYDMLKKITDGFSEERLLGSGGYGTVYKGVHKDGKTIAVKLLHEWLALDDVQFMNEFNNLMNLQHDNIVRLVGYCRETRPECVEFEGRMIVADRIHRALCLEYVHRGSLHDHLSDEFTGHDWRTRYGIIKGICNGLKYLHLDLKSPIYHLDLKPANVLLDENLLPKIADFGLSKLFGEEQTKITNTKFGTRGYLPPEYLDNNVISNKFDIFSLGVVIIKVMAGPEGHSRCVDMSSPEFVKLVHKNWRARLQGSLVYEVEPCYEQVKTCIEIALWCVEADRHKRPNIMDIVDKMNETETKIRLWMSGDAESFASAITGHGRFEYSDLADATNRFSKNNQIGEGPFSKVYKGSYTDKNGIQEVAVKEIIDNRCYRYFAKEVKIINGMRHMNLVELKGYCFLIGFMSWFRRKRSRLFLVYELVPNGNLDDHLHHREKILPWENRYHIVKGLGSALRYLHHKCYVPILHRHINPRNILLDNGFNAKLSGFGFIIEASQNNETELTVVVGTIGYTDPQTLKDGSQQFNRKHDVYSFGIVLVEIACGYKSREEVWELYRNSKTGPKVMEDAADPKLGGVFDRSEMERVIVLGLRCSHRDIEQRPYMVDAMKYLEDGIELPAIAEIEGRECASDVKETEGEQVGSAVTEIEGEHIASDVAEIGGEHIASDLA